MPDLITSDSEAVASFARAVLEVWSQGLPIPGKPPRILSFEEAVSHVLDTLYIDERNGLAEWADATLQSEEIRKQCISQQIEAWCAMNLPREYVTAERQNQKSASAMKAA